LQFLFESFIRDKTVKMRFPYVTLLTVLAASNSVSAFVTPSTNNVGTLQSNTELHVMPPMIIGPMIRKMREEKQRQKNAHGY